MCFNSNLNTKLNFVGIKYVRSLINFSANVNIKHISAYTYSAFAMTLIFD